MPCNEDINNVNICEKKASESFIHTLDIVNIDMEDGKEVEEIVDHLSEGSVGGTKDVQEIEHGEAEVGVMKPIKCSA